ncbi:GntR family transcriptional regulator [Alkalibacillus salilacus]|uniref:DNA-binding GntR family transcriptional regulator n=1 Tax=Alkalibacillus salilacus TaxID=284582 RepID=A0ABT9VB26_9BACI|nr:GntR family transcriptional regulator [Alkalibacillus salilacus]MDQ0158167.1 DNA-binding GntR family transcriptional regulator [Alkalibacillus salilacus]
MKKKTFQTIERPSLREQVYQQIKDAIVRLELEPGQKVRDQTLASDFAVSRTPVREALRRLEDEGLVEAKPGSVTKVAEIDEQEVKQATKVVASLHALAAKEACPMLTQTDLDELVTINDNLAKCLEEQDLTEAVKCDDQFHQVFLSRAGNHEIMRALEPVQPKIRRLEFAKFKSVDGINSVSDHQEIIEACYNQDANLVTTLVEQNWLSLFELLTQ